MHPRCRYRRRLDLPSHAVPTSPVGPRTRPEQPPVSQRPFVCTMGTFDTRAGNLSHVARGPPRVRRGSGAPVAGPGLHPRAARPVARRGRLRPFAATTRRGVAPPLHRRPGRVARRVVPAVPAGVRGATASPRGRVDGCIAGGARGGAGGREDRRMLLLFLSVTAGGPARSVLSAWSTRWGGRPSQRSQRSRPPRPAAGLFCTTRRRCHRRR